jgi:hypothetical protein
MQAHTKAQMNTHWITVVWGRDYTAFFLDVVLPNQLSPANLPACRLGQSVYKIYTTRVDAEVIRNAQAYRKLLEVFENNVVIIDDQLDECRSVGKYSFMTACHKHAIQVGQHTPDVAFIFLSPDAIWSDGSFVNLLRIADTGKRAIMVSGIRLVKETFIPQFVKECANKAIPSRDLVRMALHHLHPLSAALLWDSPCYSRYSAGVFWRIPHEGLLLRCFHLHPLLVRPWNVDASPLTTIDGDYLTRACPNQEDIYIVRDSDEILGCEVSNLSQGQEALVPHRATVLGIAHWVPRWTDAYHREFFKHSIRLHCGEISTAWVQKERNANRIARSILFWYKPFYYFDLLCRVLAGARARIRLRTRLRQMLNKRKPTHAVMPK